jgi:hypothetical protein
MERAEVSGASAVGLHTATFMTAAVGLYERSGFRRLPSLDLASTHLAEALGIDDDDLPTAIAYVRDVERTG